MSRADDGHEPNEGRDALTPLADYYDALAAGGDPPRRPEGLGEQVDFLHQLDRLRQVMDWDEVKRLGEPGGDWSPLAPGEDIGPYVIVRALGHGGHAVVYLADDPRTGRQVAVKVPRPECMRDANMRRRFAVEMRAAGKLSHPYIVDLYDVVEAGPLVALVFAYCPGHSLQDWLRTQAELPSPRRGASLARKLALAIAYAHQCGVLHRDLKPANVLVETCDGIDDEGETIVPRIADFGLAKLQEGSEGLTQTGTAIGTPAYMAPEQIDRRFGEVGPATDVYGVGTILFELLTGRSPFPGASALESLGRVCHDDPPRPRALRADVPADLEAIVLRCLDKSPARRYGGGQELADDLGRFLEGEPTRARPVGTIGRTARWARRRPDAAALVAVTAAATLLIAAGGYWYAGRLSRALDATQAARAEAEQTRDKLARILYGRDLKVAAEALGRRDVLRAVAALEQQLPAAGDSDMRGFVWHALWRRCHGDPAVWPAHDGAAFGIALSPDDRLVATCGADGTIRLFAAETGAPLAVLRGHTSDVNSVAFSPDGRTLASTSDDGTVRIWDVGGQREAAAWATGAEQVACASFTADGRRVLVADQRGAIQEFDVSTRQLSQILLGHSDEVNWLAVSFDGRLLASASSDGTARIWDLGQGETLHVLTGHQGSVKRVALSRDARLVATAGVDGTVRLWHTASGEFVAELRPDAEAVEGLAFADDGLTLATGSRRGLVAWWGVEDQNLQDARQTGQGRIWSLALAKNGTLYSSGADGSVRVYDALALAEFATAEVGELDPACAMFATHGDCVYTRRGEDLLEFDVERLAAKPLGHIGPTVTRVAFCPQQSLFALGDGDGELLLWSPETRSVVRRFPRANRPVTVLQFVGRGQTLIRGTARRQGVDPEILLEEWDLRSGTLRFRLGPYSEHLHCLISSPDGRWLAGVGLDDPWKLWVWRGSLDAGHRTFQRAENPDPQFVDFFPDSRSLVVSDRNGTTLVLDVETGQLRARWQMGTGACVPVVPRREPVLLLIDQEGACHVLDREHFEHLVTLSLPESDCGQALLADDERTLVTMHVWAPRHPQPKLCAWSLKSRADLSAVAKTGR